MVAHTLAYSAKFYSYSQLILQGNNMLLSRFAARWMPACLHSHRTYFNVEPDKSGDSIVQHIIPGGAKSLTWFI